MNKYVLISMILSLLVTGDVIDKHPQDATMESFIIETVNAFKLPVGIHQHCCFSGRPWQQQNFRMVHIDLNHDGKEEILLECNPIDYIWKKADQEMKWIVLQKAFNDGYICIGKIGMPIKINKHKGSTWSEIVAYKNPDENSKINKEDTCAFALYHYIVGKYKEFVSTDLKSELPVSQVPAELERLISPENAKLRNDDYKHIVELGSELGVSLELIKSLLLHALPEQRKELILSVMEYIKRLNSCSLKVIIARDFADMLLDLRAYEQAMNMYEVALDAQIHVLPDDAAGYAEILYNYAIMFIQIENLSMAEQKLSEAVSLYRTAIVKNASYKCDLASSLVNLSSVHYKQKNYASCETELQEAIQIYESLSSENLDEEHMAGLGFAYGNLAEVCDKSGREAKDYFVKALEFFEKVPNPKTISFLRKHAEVLEDISDYYQKKGNMTEAIAKQEMAYEKWGIVAGNNKAYLAEFCASAHTLACLLRDSGKLEKSLGIFEGIMKFRLQLAQKGGWELELAYLDTVIETVYAYVKTQQYTKAQQLLDFAEKQRFYMNHKTENRFEKAKAEVKLRMEQ